MGFHVNQILKAMKKRSSNDVGTIVDTIVNSDFDETDLTEPKKSWADSDSESDTCSPMSPSRTQGSLGHVETDMMEQDALLSEDVMDVDALVSEGKEIDDQENTYQRTMLMEAVLKNNASAVQRQYFHPRIPPLQQP